MKYYLRKELRNELGKTHIFTSTDLRTPSLCGKSRWGGIWVMTTDEKNLCPLCKMRRRHTKQGD